MPNPLINVAIDRFAEQFALGTLRAFLKARSEGEELQAAIACEWEIKKAADAFAAFLAEFRPGEDESLLAEALVSQCRAALAVKVATVKVKPSQRRFP